MTETLEPCPCCNSNKLQKHHECNDVLVTCQNCETSSWLDIWQKRPIEDALRTRVKILEEALGKIARWHGEFPNTDLRWEDGSTMSYGAAFGSNGQRDYMRNIDKAALEKV